MDRRYLREGVVHRVYCKVQGTIVSQVRSVDSQKIIVDPLQRNSLPMSKDTLLNFFLISYMNVHRSKGKLVILDPDTCLNVYF